MKKIIYILFFLPVFCSAQQFIESADINGNVTVVEIDVESFNSLGKLVELVKQLNQEVQDLRSKIEAISDQPETTPIEDAIKLELIFLRDNAEDYEYIFDRYNLGTNARNGFSLRELAEGLSIDHTGLTKGDVSRKIFEELQ